MQPFAKRQQYGLGDSHKKPVALRDGENKVTNDGFHRSPRHSHRREIIFRVVYCRSSMRRDYETIQSQWQCTQKFSLNKNAIVNTKNVSIIRRNDTQKLCDSAYRELLASHSEHMMTMAKFEESTEIGREDRRCENRKIPVHALPIPLSAHGSHMKR